MISPLTRLVPLMLGLFYSAVLLAAPLVTVKIEGVSGELLTNVQQWLTIEQQRQHPLLTEGRIRRLHSKADQEIRDALKPYGYYRPTIEKSLSHVGDQWHATYRIDPGEPLRITALDLKLEGAATGDESFRKLWHTFPLHEGAILNQAAYEKFKRDLMKLAGEHGYFDAKFTTARITINLANYTAQVTLDFDSGPRYHFGETHLEQNVLDDDFLHRFIPYSRNDPYDVNKLLELQQGLMGSDYFKVVELQPQSPNHSDYSVPVVVSLDPRHANRYLMSLGYGTDTEARAKLGWEVPRVNRYGHRFDTELKVSGIGNSISGRYRIPIQDPRHDELIFSGSRANTRLETSKSTITNLAASLLQLQGEWQETISLTYHKENYEIAGVERTTTLLMPGVSLSRQIGRGHVLVDQGMKIGIEARGGAKKALSDTDFVQAQLHLKGITSLSERQRLITRGTLGGTNALDFDKVPASLRFYAGGTQSIRGYRYKSLGPTDSAGNVIGGKYLVTGSVEYELRLTSEWGWALFIDGGNAFNSNYSKTPMKKGAGTGVRWQTPVGPLRFDIAWALSEPNRPWRLHLNIGPDL